VWFENWVERKIEDEVNTRFWKDRWIGGDSLQNKVPRLFLNSEQREEHVRKLGKRVEEVCRWEFKWRRE